jgi:hypothetical protein
MCTSWRRKSREMFVETQDWPVLDGGERVTFDERRSRS